MSADWALARRFTLPWTAAASTLTAARPPAWTPKSSASRYPVTTSDEAMKVFDGTQSDSTQAPPAPSASTTVTSASSWAATSAASYPAGPPPMMTIRPTTPSTSRRSAPGPPTRSVVFSRTAPGDYRHRRASLRRLRFQSRPRTDAGLLPTLPHGRYRLVGGLAADLRRGGRARLGGRGLHDRRVLRRSGVR